MYEVHWGLLIASVEVMYHDLKRKKEEERKVSNFCQNDCYHHGIIPVLEETIVEYKVPLAPRLGIAYHNQKMLLIYETD